MNTESMVRNLYTVSWIFLNLECGYRYPLGGAQERNNNVALFTVRENSHVPCFMVIETFRQWDRRRVGGHLYHKFLGIHILMEI